MPVQRVIQYDSYRRGAVHIMDTFKRKIFKLSWIAMGLTVLAAPVEAQEIHTRVLNGAPSTDAAPWMVSLQSYNDTESVSHICGGTLIGPDTVLTAAHCVEQFVTTPEQLEILIGTARLSAPGDRIPAADIIVYPGFDNTTYKSDIALVKLARPSLVTTFPTPISEAEMVTASQAPLRLFGWGLIFSDLPVRPDHLQQADLPLIEDSQCAERLGLDFDAGVMLCAGTLATSTTSDDGVDACEGDSGGPLVSFINNQPRIVGLVSWGFGCGSSKVWGAYTRISRFSDWIASNPVVPPYMISGVGVLGTPVEGATLTCDPGEWGGAEPLEQTFAWIDSDQGVISERNSPKFKLTRRDVGRILSCIVTTTNAGGSVEASSEPTLTVLPREKKKTPQSRSNLKTQCSGRSCVTVLGAGERIARARVIIMADGAKARVVEPQFASTTAVAVRYRENLRGKLIFRLVFKSGRTIVKEIKLGK